MHNRRNCFILSSWLSPVVIILSFRLLFFCFVFRRAASGAFKNLWNSASPLRMTWKSFSGGPPAKVTFKRQLKCWHVLSTFRDTFEKGNNRGTISLRLKYWNFAEISCKAAQRRDTNCVLDSEELRQKIDFHKLSEFKMPSKEYFSSEDLFLDFWLLASSKKNRVNETV